MIELIQNGEKKKKYSELINNLYWCFTLQCHYLFLKKITSDSCYKRALPRENKMNLIWTQFKLSQLFLFFINCYILLKRLERLFFFVCINLLRSRIENFGITINYILSKHECVDLWFQVGASFSLIIIENTILG